MLISSRGVPARIRRSRSLPILDQRVQQQIAEEFQPKLLMYRLVNYRRASVSELDVSDFTSPVRDLARCLGASVPDEPELQGEIAPLLRFRQFTITQSNA